MMPAALRTIGEAIIEDKYITEYQPYYTASPISGSNKTIESVVVVRFERVSDRMEYLDTQLVKPEESPEATANTFGYVYSSGKTDNSVTKRLTENNPVDERYPAMGEWFDEDVLGDELLSNPQIAGVRSIISEEVGSTYEQIKQDIDNIAQRVEYRALLTLSITEDGEERYVGDLDAYNEGMKRWAAADLQTKSTAKDNYGFARCSVCDEEIECFGLGAKMGEQYAVKQQWPFPGVNSSKAWRNRPLCMDCITAIEVAADQFLEAQDYGIPGVRCRVIPYALPMPNANEQLKALIREARFELSGGDDTENNEDDADDAEGVRERPLSTVWERYRNAVEANDRPNALRLAFSHVIRESTKTHGVAWIDGVSVDQVATLRRGIEDLYESDPVFEQGLLPQPDPPNERQLFSGNWLFWLLAGVRGSDHRGQYIGDETPWVEYTERLLTNGSINYDEVVAVLMREIRARYRDRLGDDTEYPYDGFHLAATYGFLRLVSAQGILQDTRIDETQTNGENRATAMTMHTLDGSYTSFGDGIQEFVTAHPSIENSPGRTAAFVLGAAAAQLSNWQAYRGNSRTFVQSRDVDQLTAETLTRWQTDIWEKAKVYNSQEGNYGIPWADAESLFHEANLAGENDGWQATAEEIRYHYVLGVNVGPNISQQAQDNREDADIPTTEDGEPIPNPAAEGEPDESSDERESSPTTTTEAHQ
jgi:hypothetical protein